jgi:hypothetical protein
MWGRSRRRVRREDTSVLPIVPPSGDRILRLGSLLRRRHMPPLAHPLVRAFYFSAL